MKQQTKNQRSNGKLPCEKCITLAVCKATALQYDKGHEGIRVIYDKCSILRDYLESNYKKIVKTNPQVETIDLEIVYRFFLPHIFDKLLYQQRNISRIPRIKI